jgi:uncharacterized protein (TIGR02677 family)
MTDFASTSALVFTQGHLFRHVSADKATLYRAVMDAFAAAKREFVPYLRPDEVLARISHRDYAAAVESVAAPPTLDEVQSALAQLADWGNVDSQPDTARVSSIEDFYRARFLYRLTEGGEAVETALTTFAHALRRRAELQSVALEDIASRLQSLSALAAAESPDAAKVHEVLRDLAQRLGDLADNAQAFMAGVARGIDLQQTDMAALLAWKQRLISYLERFISDLVARSTVIAERIARLQPKIEPLLWLAARREARDAAPDDAGQRDALDERMSAWRQRWHGLSRWFIAADGEVAQAELLRGRALAAIPQLMTAVANLNDRRSGRSDRSADFRLLARWFNDCSDGDAHRLWRAAFALNPARHLSLCAEEDDVAAATSWSDAPTIAIHPRLREYGTATPKGPPPRVKERAQERELLARQLADEHAQVEAARERLATGEAITLSALGTLDRHAFRLFLALLGEALAAQTEPDAAIERQTSDGLLRVRLEPLGAETFACIETELGTFSGRDHRLTITNTAGAGASEAEPA